MRIVPLHTAESNAVERLLDRAFGNGRRERTAYRIRKGAAAVPALSFAMVEANELIGSIQCWPVALTNEDGRRHDLIMVGPVAVEPERQRDGIGRSLMAAALDAAAAERLDGALMLIGDPEYYGRFFGFTADRTGGWQVPGPVERRRLLARGEAVPDVAGLLGPRVVQPA